MLCLPGITVFGMILPCNFKALARVTRKLFHEKVNIEGFLTSLFSYPFSPCNDETSN